MLSLKLKDSVTNLTNYSIAKKLVEDYEYFIEITILP